MENYIDQGVFSLMEQGSHGRLEAVDSDKKVHGSANFRVILCLFKAESAETIKAKKSHVQEAFYELGYQLNVACCSLQSPKHFEKDKLKEMEDAYSQMFRLKTAGIRDTIFWMPPHLNTYAQKTLLMDG